MIHTLTVTNFRGESKVFDFDRMSTAPLKILSIKGVGPNKANINTVEVATNDGSIYNSARVEARNIVIKIGFDGWDIEALRQESYKYFPLKKPVTLEFLTDHRDTVITGYVESNEPDIFSKLETTQISIVCPYPYFYSAESQAEDTVFYGEEPLFEFPFEDPVDESPSIEFGQINNVTEANIKYDGDAEIGVTFTAHAVGPVSNLSIFDLDTGERMTVKIDMIAGDDLIISTVKSKKYVRLLRNGVYSNMLNALDRNSSWVQLKKGDNAFAYTADSGLLNLQFRVQNDVLYEGI